MAKIGCTGASGFVGSYLYDLLEKDNEVERFDKRYFGEDICDRQTVDDWVDAGKFDYVYHLCAKAFVPTSFVDPIQVMEVNLMGTLNLLEAVRKFSPHTKVLIAGSSEEYGLVRDDEIPINEQNPLRPQSTYAVSKIAADFLSQQYVRSYGLHIVVTRAFNHTGAGRPDYYAESSFARQIVEIEKGMRETLEHGNLDSYRDYTHVKDMVRAYSLAIDLPPDNYNIASGICHSMREVIEELRKQSKVKHLEMIENPSRGRVSDVPILRGDSSKFRSMTGWEPKLGIKEICRDLINYWRKNI